MKKIKKKIVFARKFLSILFFNLLYGKINSSIKANKSFYNNYTIKFGNSKNYKLHLMKNTRVFYNKITDVAYINNNNIIKETSNQLRNYKNSKFRNNSVFINGTHNFIKKLKGPVFSFLYSVSAKENYWHWIFDVLPKIAILKKNLI